MPPFVFHHRATEKNEKLSTPVPSAGATGQADPHRLTQTYPLQTSAEDKRSTLRGMKKEHYAFVNPFQNGGCFSVTQEGISRPLPSVA